MKISLSENEKEVINLTSNMISHFGLSEAASRIWATLVLIGKPLSQSDLKELTNYSLSVISINLSLLEKIGFIRKSAKKGKKKMYEAKATLFDILQFFLRNITGLKLLSVISYLDTHVNDLSNTSKMNAKKLLNECNKMKQVILLMLEIIRKTKYISYTDISEVIDIKEPVLVE